MTYLSNHAKEVIEEVIRESGKLPFNNEVMNLRDAGIEVLYKLQRFENMSFTLGLVHPLDKQAKQSHKSVLQEETINHQCLESGQQKAASQNEAPSASEWHRCLCEPKNLLLLPIHSHKSAGE